MTFGDEWSWGSPKAEAQKVYETYDFPASGRAAPVPLPGGEWPGNDSYAIGEFVTIPKPEGMHDRKQDESHPS